MRRLAACVVAVLSIAEDGRAQHPTEATPQPKSTPQDIAAGARIYGSQCAYCHGTRGEGGRGAVLARRRLLHAADDLAVFHLIAQGIPGTEMPGNPLSASEIWQMVAFIRTLGLVEQQPLTGNPARGEELYRTKGGCTRCHTLAGRGGALGPDLTEVGGRRSAAYLREALTNPEAAVPDGFLQVHLMTTNGRKITGVRLNEDAFSIQIRDLSDIFRSFWKSELAEFHRDAGRSPMPGYREAFTSAELDDVVAFLASQQGGL
ncbi:MAG: hypothetical protein DMG57_05860 [Acidobacteria bacterium]|nr:MAG: hypothetical protein DMG57_05860 [Acidobacteriota bacterium]